MIIFYYSTWHSSVTLLHSSDRVLEKNTFKNLDLSEDNCRIMYLLTKRESRMGKYLAGGHGVRTENQTFSHPARPNLANKYFII